MYQKIQETIDQIKRLERTKYGLWKGQNLFRTEEPFYALNLKIPDLDYIRDNLSISCAGIANIMRRYNNKLIPCHNIFPGGTKAWESFLMENKLLYIFSIDYNDCKKLNRDLFVDKGINNKVIFPIGTLLFRRYKDNDDQGHIAVVVDPDKNLIIHSYYTELNENNIKLDPGVVIEDINISNNWLHKDINYYEYFSLPIDWLFHQ